MNKSVFINTICICVINLFCQNIYGQNIINIIQANQFKKNTINDTIFQNFSGNVIVEYNNFQILCDTVLIDDNKTIIRAWKNTKIMNDTINCQTDSMIIKTLSKDLFFYHNTRLKKDSMTIKSNDMRYDYNNQFLYYYNSGSVTNSAYEIKSETMTHDTQKNSSVFNKNVMLKSNNYEIASNQIILEKKIITFGEATSIKENNSNITCNQGFLRNNNYLELSDDVIVNIDNTIIQSDVLKKEIEKKTSQFIKNIKVTLEDQTELFSQEMIKNDSIILMNNNCKIKIINKNESILIQGDSIKIDDKNKEIDINNNVTILGENLEGKCELLTFRSNYQNITMYQDPVLWLSDKQVTGESIVIYKKNNIIDSIYIEKNPFIVSSIDSLKYYNQIKGRWMEGKFQNTHINYIQIHGNSKMKYFDKNSNNQIGMNDVESGRIKLVFNRNELQQVLCFEEIESNYIEITSDKYDSNTPTSFYLDGFNLQHRLELQ